MDTELDPVVGQWYRHAAKDELFRVISFDEDRAVLEIQHFDGDVEEMDASDWYDMDVEPTETPEEWAGLSDDLDDEEDDEDDYTDDSESDDWDDDDWDDDEDDGRDD